MSKGVKLSSEELQERIEFAKTHRSEDFAERYNMTKGSAVCWYSLNGLRQPDSLNKRRFRIDKNDFIEYVKDHTVKEACCHFSITSQTVYRYEREYKARCIRDILSRKSVEQCCKHCGTATEMIKVLIPVFTDASIARVFGYSRQRIQQIRKELENGGGNV